MIAAVDAVFPTNAAPRSSIFIPDFTFLVLFTLPSFDLQSRFQWPTFPHLKHFSVDLLDFYSPCCSFAFDHLVFAANALLS